MQNREIIEKTMPQIFKARDKDRENISIMQKRLKEKQEYSDLLKSELQKVESANNDYKQKLSMNNYKEKLLQQSLARYKDVIAKMVNYLKEIEQNLETISYESLENIHKENEEKLQKLQNKCIEKLEEVSRQCQQHNEAMNADLLDIEQKNESEHNIAGLNEEWNELLTQVENKSKKIQSLNADEVETIFVRLVKCNDEEETTGRQLWSSMDENTIHWINGIADVQSVNNEIIKIKEEINSTNLKRVELFEGPDVQKELAESNEDLRRIDKEISEVNASIEEVDKKNTERDLSEQLEVSFKIAEDNKAALTIEENNVCDAEKALNELQAKLNALDEEISIHITERDSTLQEKENYAGEIEESGKEMEEMKLNSEKALESTSNKEINVTFKTKELEDLRLRTNTDIHLMEDQLGTVGNEFSETQKNKGLENDDIETQNKNFQTNIENLEANIKEYTTQLTNLQSERAEALGKLKDLNSKCDKVSEEIRSVGFVPVSRSPKLFSTPTSKPQRPKKSSVMDDSISSIEGDRIPVRDFLAKRRIRSKK